MMFIMMMKKRLCFWTDAPSAYTNERKPFPKKKPGQRLMKKKTGRKFCQNRQEMAVQLCGIFAFGPWICLQKSQKMFCSPVPWTVPKRFGSFWWRSILAIRNGKGRFWPSWIRRNHRIGTWLCASWKIGESKPTVPVWKNCWRKKKARNFGSFWKQF